MLAYLAVGSKAAAASASSCACCTYLGSALQRVTVARDALARCHWLRFPAVVPGRWSPLRMLARMFAPDGCHVYPAVSVRGEGVGGGVSPPLATGCLPPALAVAGQRRCCARMLDRFCSLHSLSLASNFEKFEKVLE